LRRALLRRKIAAKQWSLARPDVGNKTMFWIGMVPLQSSI